MHAHRRTAFAIAFLATPFLAAALSAAPFTARAATYVVTFTGVVTNSLDPGPSGQPGSVFGGLQEQGQTNQTISGAFTINTAAYPDGNGDSFIGTYSPPGIPFPQPANNFVSQYTVAGQSFFPSIHMGQIPSHSIEQAEVRPPYGVNFIQQDFFRLQDGSQFLLCGNPQDAQSCTGGALRTDSLFIRLAAFVDFLANDGLEHSFSFDEAALDAIRAGGGIAAGEYLHQYSPTNEPQSSFNATGEFRLTAISMGLQTTTEEPGGNAIPEPGSLALLLSGAITALLVRRRARH